MYVKLTAPERFRDLREEKGLSQDQVAELTDISKSSISNYESVENKEISSYSIKKLAEFYGVSELYLIGFTENRNPPDMEIQELHLDDKTLEILRTGKFNHRLLCEIIKHKGFNRLMTDAEIVVDRIADMRVEQMNATFEMARQEVIKKYTPDKDDVHMRTLELAQIPEDDFFNHVVHKDIDRIINDIREAHKTDTTTADEQTAAENVQSEFQDIIQSGVSGEEAFIRIFCEQMEIPYDKLTSKEFTTFLKILNKSQKVKNSQSRRGKKPPIFKKKQKH